MQWGKYEHGRVTLHLRHGYGISFDGKVRVGWEDGEDTISSYEATGVAALMVPPFRDLCGITCEPIAQAVESEA